METLFFIYSWMDEQTLRGLYLYPDPRDEPPAGWRRVAGAKLR